MNAILPIISIILFLVVAAIFSTNRRAINKRTVICSLLLQTAIAGFILYLPLGKTIFVGIANFVRTTIGFSQAGIDFLFGPLGSPELHGFLFAFHVLPVLVFFSSLIAVLYHLGVIQYVIKLIGSAIQKLLGTSEAESCAATANIMIGGTEVYLLMRPYVPKMTNSELFALMVGGAASISGALLVGYSQMGVELEYLLAAVFMSAPGGLLISKVMVPETDNPQEIDLKVSYDDSEPVNVIDAATRGAISGANMAVTIGAMLLAIISLVALINGILGALGGVVGFENLSLELVFGYALSPITYLLGVPWENAIAAGGLLGEKIVLNEFVAYASLVEIQDTFSDDTKIIIVIALAGFANLATPAGLLGVLAVMIPERRPFIARFAVKVILGGVLANLVSAAIASLLISLS